MKYSGQRFPDIVVGGYYGVEVKTRKLITGSRREAVLLREPGGRCGASVSFVWKNVNRFVLFASLYEECLSEVVVTHSPRYLVDMNLSKGETIFDKLGIPYNELRRQPNPIRTILDYYRSRLKEGEELWWLDNDHSKVSNLVIRMWSSLSPQEKQR